MGGGIGQLIPKRYYDSNRTKSAHQFCFGIPKKLLSFVPSLFFCFNGRLCTCFFLLILDFLFHGQLCILFPMYNIYGSMAYTYMSRKKTPQIEQRKYANKAHDDRTICIHRLTQRSLPQSSLSNYTTVRLLIFVSCGVSFALLPLCIAIALWYLDKWLRTSFINTSFASRIELSMSW